MTPFLRNALVLLLAMMLGGAPLAQSLGVPGDAECAVQQAGLSDDGCCGDAESGASCAACAAGCVLFMPVAALRKPADCRFASPSMPAPSSLAAHLRAPDTAPPKYPFA